MLYFKIYEIERLRNYLLQDGQSGYYMCVCVCETVFSATLFSVDVMAPGNSVLYVVMFCHIKNNLHV